MCKARSRWVLNNKNFDEKADFKLNPDIQILKLENL